MNPAFQIVRKVFPSSYAADRSDIVRRNSNAGNSLVLTGGKNEETNVNSQEVQRLRQTVFKLNMDIAACRGAKQRLQKTVQCYENMESYYLTELEVRKARADCLEAQLALVLEQFPSHKQLKAPDKTECCQGCQDSERVIAKLAHELNLKNQLLVLLDNSFKQAMGKVSQCLKEQKSQVKVIQQAQDDKQNTNHAKSKPKEIHNPNTRLPLELSEAHQQDEHQSYKKSKVILKRVMPQRENLASFDRNFDK